MRWLLNRARCMAPAEFPHRAWRAIAAQAERCGLSGRGPAPSPDLAASAGRWVRAPAGLDPLPYLEAAGRIAAGRLDVFSLRDFEIGAVPRWNRDPKSGIEAPRSFGRLIDYRDTALVGDIKYLWELNRHQHLVTLAQSHALGGGEAPLAVLRRQLDAWFLECPHRIGPNWASALEAAIRLINWAVAWQLIGGARAPFFRGEGGAFRSRWLQSIHQHAQFVRGNLSRHSSANNHLIGEAAGLFIAGLTWPHWREARRWTTEAHAILVRETLLQNAPDGVNREQAVSYQQYVLDLLMLALQAGRANGVGFPVAVLARVEAMLEYLAAIMDARGHVPMIGDSDDGIVVRLSQDETFCRYRSVLAAGALLFDRDDFRFKAGRADDKTRWLFGAADERPSQAAAGTARGPVRRAFEDGGQYILGCDFETEREIRLVADAGPLGYLSIAAHGHADALAFTLSVGGHEFLIDPGTYAYHAEPEWRRYFRGSSAHNTIAVDGQDQSEPGGNFLWLRKAAATVHEWRSGADRDLLEASHDGYTRLSDPVVHRRRILLDKRERRIRIDDRLTMSGTHDVELFFHCAEDCEVLRQPDGFVLRRDGVAVALRLPAAAGAHCELRRAAMAPILGWVSRRFGEKAPAHTIVWRARLTGDTRLECELRC